MIADHPSIMEFILNGRDKTEERLASAIDFKLIAGKIARQPGGEHLFLRPGSQRTDARSTSRSSRQQPVLQSAQRWADRQSDAAVVGTVEVFGSAGQHDRQ
jgi:hypothetical protein